MEKKVDEIREEGMRLFDDGMYPEAAAAFEQAHQVYEEQADAAHAAEMLNNLGVVYRLEGQYDDALSTLTAAHDAFERLGDRSRAAQALGNLGGVYSRRRDTEQAMDCLKRAAGMFEELGDGQKRCEVLLALSAVCAKRGRWMEALYTYEAGLSALEHPNVTQRALRGLFRIPQRFLAG